MYVYKYIIVIGYIWYMDLTDSFDSDAVITSKKLYLRLYYVNLAASSLAEFSF